MFHGRRVSRALRVFSLLALLTVAPALRAADPEPDPSWIDILSSWFVSLLDTEPASTEEDNGTIRLPGG